MDLRKKILNLNEGLTIYSQLLKDEETILIPFAISQYVTVCRINELLPEYLEDLERNECKEPLCLDFDQMTSVDYWMGKLVKLRSDMEMLGIVPMKEHGFVVTVLGFSPETTMDLYRAIEREILQMVEMLKKVEEKLLKAPVTMYGNFYRHLRAQYCEEKAVSDFRNWLRSSGIITCDKLNTLRAKAIADFINGGTLNCIDAPSIEEGDKVGVAQFKKQLSGEYKYAEWFDDCYAIFCRTISWKGDIVVPDYSCAGLFIFQHWDQLTENDIQAIFYLDKMLELIHEKMTALTHETATTLPEALATPEAMVLWQKVQEAAYVDENYQPLLSRTQSAMLAYEMARCLGIREKWKVFEKLWGKNNLRGKYNEALNQRQTLAFQDELKKLFPE